MTTRFEIAVQHLRRPQLSVTGDEFDDAFGRQLCDPDTSQHFFNRIEIGSDDFGERLGLRGAEFEFSDSLEMSHLEIGEVCEV